MRALHYDGQLTFNPDFPIPVRNPGESLIRVLKSGICLTDIHLMRGYMAFRGILGHEFVGIVEDSDTASLIGQRVVGEINAACHQCDTCRMGNPTHCPNRTTLGIDRRNGSHAEYTLLPDVNLLPVPASISNEAAVFTEPLAAACEITQQLHLQPMDRVVVIGDGKLGLLVAQVLALTGCNLHVIGRHTAKLAILERRGIRVELVAPQSESQLPYHWADIVVECTGNPSGFATAERLVRPRGTLVLKSTYAESLSLNLSRIVVDEITLKGSRCGPFAPALRLLEAGLIDVTSMHTASYSLNDGIQAMNHATQRGALKIILDMNDA
jgi:threonine dehydrogenase-like Zn-dependent dehydrogenase